ncbi:hypothetical protein POM88_042340 [Heracleum sosnowskyi]|uniref:Uncharacterized protein n=1 Tax=Heracleum sosnowskyi TaxID=360622 RepID=A0AAD8HI11_9APIA|nr:hypothetical protein POM88_042340 [Heracleum sosnowskyi]
MYSVGFRASRVTSGLKLKSAPSPFSLPTLKPPSAHRILRSPVLMSFALESVLPFHTATTSALLTSLLSVSPRTFGWTLEGAWVHIALALIFMVIMYVSHFGTLKKHEFDFQNKVSVDWLLSLSPSLDIVRVCGIGLIHTELVSGIPSIFSHLCQESQQSHLW